MSEDLIVRHCAPTLAGLKTGNMFTATFASKAQLDSEVQQLNQILADACGRPIEDLDRDTDRDHWMTAKEALEYGIVDKILESKK